MTEPSAIIFDCEFLTAEGAPQRFWCGPSDPDPIVVQIGAARLGLLPPFAILDTFDVIVRPTDRGGALVIPDPVFHSLTGLGQDRIASEGRSLVAALADFARFCGTARIWSWGKDELNLMAISAYVAGIEPPVPACRFGNACSLLVQAGVPETKVHGLRSHTLCDHFGLPRPDGCPHDALYDALSLARVLAHLLASASLEPAALRMPSP